MLRSLFSNHKSSTRSRTFDQDNFRDSWTGKTSPFRSSSWSNFFSGSRFGFSNRSFPPLPRKFTNPSFNNDKADNVEVTPQGAIVDFSNKITINVGFNPTNNDPAFTTELTGKSQILFGKAEDSIKNDPLLGTIGKVDGKLDVSKSEIVRSISAGQTPLGDNIKVSIGDGNPDLKFSADTPPLSLASGGAFSLESDNLLCYGGELKSFYNIFLEIQDAPNGSLRNKTPIVVESDFSDNVFSRNQLNLNYSTRSVVPLYTAGADGIYWTGDEQIVAKLVPGANGNSLTVNLSTELG